MQYLSVIMCGLLLSSASWAGELMIYKSAVPAAAGAGAIDGRVVYQVYESAASDQAALPIGRCMLQHGYVISQSMLDKIGEARNPSRQFEIFVSTYFSPQFIAALLAQTCGRVIVGMHEAILSTTLEMTQRTEEFMRDVVCRDQNCAIFGHSKGGAAVTSMARRCMQQTSLMGAEGCRQVAKFYSSAGNNQGASYGAIIYGFYLDNPKALYLKVMQALAQIFKIDINVTSESSMAYQPGKNNPMWVDIGPVSPMEGGVPIHRKNNVRLEHRGWLTGKYAASNTEHDFAASDEALYGCGPSSAWRNYKGCVLAGGVLPVLHVEKLRPYFERGLSAWRQDPRFADPTTGDHSYLDGLTWESHQIGDGLADYEMSMRPCLNGGSAVASCRALSDASHFATAGGGPEVLADVLAFFLQ